MLEYVIGLLTSVWKFLGGIVEMSDFLGVAPWMAITAIATWIGQAFIYRKDVRKMELDHSATVDASRAELALELLGSARNEVVQARSEMESLREEVKSLRAMETHFYHFQQAIEHLSAVLFAADDADRANAERNAKAFLARMKRLQEAKGTIANEAQRLDSSLKQAERKVREEGGQV
jgi:hypothetical protein